jgi:hypothetical protein
VKEYERQRKEVLTEIKTLKSEWKKSVSVFEKIKKNKDLAIKVAEDARIAFEKANNDMNVTKAYVEKLREDYATKARRTLVVKEEYIQGASEIKKKKWQFYNETLSSSFDKLQKIEEGRISKTKLHLKEFGTSLKCAVMEETLVITSILEKWDALHPETIIEAFIASVKSEEGEGILEYPEDYLFDDCASNECLGLTKVTAVKQPSNGLFLSKDFESMQLRLSEIDNDLPILQKEKDGLNTLGQLYERQPELADHATKSEVYSQLETLTLKLKDLDLEKKNLQQCLFSRRSDSTKGVLSEEFAAHESFGSATIKSPHLSRIEEDGKEGNARYLDSEINNLVE